MTLHGEPTPSLNNHFPGFYWRDHLFWVIHYLNLSLDTRQLTVYWCSTKRSSKLDPKSKQHEWKVLIHHYFFKTAIKKKNLTKQLGDTFRRKVLYESSPSPRVNAAFTVITMETKQTSPWKPVDRFEGGFKVYGNTSGLELVLQTAARFPPFATLDWKPHFKLSSITSRLELRIIRDWASHNLTINK